MLAIKLSACLRPVACVCRPSQCPKSGSEFCNRGAVNYNRVRAAGYSWRDWAAKIAIKNSQNSRLSLANIFAIRNWVRHIQISQSLTKIQNSQSLTIIIMAKWSIFFLGNSLTQIYIFTNLQSAINMVKLANSANLKLGLATKPTILNKMVSFKMRKNDI